MKIMSLLGNMLEFFTPYMSKKSRILIELQKHKRVSLDTMAKISKNHTARISELRKEGYKIECHEIKMKK